MRLPAYLKDIEQRTFYAAVAGSALGVILLGGSVLGWNYVVRPYLARRRTMSVNAPVAANPSEAQTLQQEPAAMQVRSAGPEAMRDNPGETWDGVDQASDELFPSSDPPSHSPGVATALNTAPKAVEVPEEDDASTTSRRPPSTRRKQVH